MSWVGIVVVVLAVWLALKVAGVLLKLLLWALVAAGIYWFVAPYLHLPQLF